MIRLARARPETPARERTRPWRTMPHTILGMSIDHLLEGVQVIGFDWKYLYVNATAARQGQSTPDALLGRTLLEAYPGIDRTDLFPVLDSVMRHRGSRRLVNEFVLPDGTTRTFELCVEPVPDGILILSLDVTDRIAAERQLLQAQKLETLALLAGGIAHDFNNVLTAILGYAELISEQIGPDKPIGRDIQEIVHAAQRASSMTRQLLTFTRKGSRALETVSLNTLVADMEPMLSRLLPETIRIESSLAANLCPVKADKTELEQLVLNLAINARDAMPQGGTIALATANAALDAAFPHGAEIAPGDYAMLTVSDTGTGMTPEVKARIFEPFFTTKEAGHGTGLGLAAAQTVVDALGGHIFVYSEPGQGTVFKIYLPRARAALHDAAAPTRERQPAPIGNERILLVEDEPAVRAFVRRVLERHGYAVTAVPTAEAALRLVTDTVRFDLIATDIVLSGMAGPELAEEARRLSPGLRSFFMSGYTSAAHTRLPENAHVLEKPFTAHRLLAAVRDALDAPAA